MFTCCFICSIQLLFTSTASSYSPIKLTCGLYSITSGVSSWIDAIVSCTLCNLQNLTLKCLSCWRSLLFLTLKCLSCWCSLLFLTLKYLSCCRSMKFLSWHITRHQWNNEHRKFADNLCRKRHRQHYPYHWEPRYCSYPWLVIIL